MRERQNEARESLIKARKAESIAQNRDEESEQLRSTCDRNHRNEVEDELDDLTERYDELVKVQSVTLPKFLDVSSVKPTTSSDAATDAKISRNEAETNSVPSWPKID